MRFLIELEGPIVDVAPTYFRAYHESAGQVGWSRLDQATYWRMLRTKGRTADVLPGAKPSKCEEFDNLFKQRIDQAETVAQFVVRPGLPDVFHTLARHGSCHVVTLGANLDARRALLERAKLLPPIADVAALPADPRLRPAELKKLAQADKRTLVVAATDTILRAAREAELLGVGLSCGTCTPARLHQAGVDIVYAQLSDLSASLTDGAKDLINAGLLPPSWG